MKDSEGESRIDESQSHESEDWGQRTGSEGDVDLLELQGGDWQSRHWQKQRRDGWDQCWEIGQDSIYRQPGQYGSGD